ncbi:MAG: hydroxymethylpyrimidine/phosphomethylpyrimidine kinase [Chitinophagaceae bacterium]
MKHERPSILIIAGFDQSAGAGILADVKTAEMHSVYAQAVCTGFTFQNEQRIDGIHWFSMDEICRQIDLCFETTFFQWVKIGIGRSAAMLLQIIQHLQQHNAEIKIVLDPVIRSSGGTDFWNGIDPVAFETVLRQVYLVTPNWNEIEYLYPEHDVMEKCEALSVFGNIYLKGGHNPHTPGIDYLWNNGCMEMLEPMVKEVFPKHGSGCVLSSALTANLALGYELPEAAIRSKRYIEQFLNSNSTLLGWHQL